MSGRLALCFTVLLALGPPVGVLGSIPEDGTGKVPWYHLFGFEVVSGAEQSLWRINLQSQCETCQEGVVDYKTEGLGLFRVSGGLSLWNIPLIDFHHERPFDPSGRQREMLRANRTQEAGAEKYAFGVALDPIATHYFSDQRLLTKVLRRIASLKYRQSTELFWGNAEVRQASIYLPPGAGIDYQIPAIVNGIPLSAGDDVAFRTVFSDQELSMAVWDFRFEFLHLAGNTLRFGFYRSRWDRISDTRLNLSPDPILFEGKFRGRGFLVSFESTDAGAPGLNFNVIMKWGLNNSLESAIDWEKLFEENTRVQTNLIEYGAWYNFYINKATRSGLFISPGGTMDLRDAKVHINPGAFEDPFPEAANSDTIFKLFATAGYRF